MTEWMRASAESIRIRKKEEYLNEFANLNILRRAMKFMKLELGFTGNRLYKFKCETEAENQVDDKIAEK